MSEPTTYHFTLNGHPVQVHAPPMRRMLDILRENFGLIGTKNGCGEGDCGACTILIDGDPVVSCLVPVVQIEGADIWTIEGLTGDGRLQPLQSAFLECGGTQCGSCTPGLLVTAYAHLAGGGGTGGEELREALGGVLCRCSGYKRVIESVQAAAQQMTDNTPADAPQP
jgi:carbon-monoxide dehydrogenase small subunit